MHYETDVSEFWDLCPQKPIDLRDKSPPICIFFYIVLNQSEGCSCMVDNAAYTTVASTEPYTIINKH